MTRAKALGRVILSPLLGRPRLQPFFHSLHNVALAGMGYGEGGNPASSGEARVLDYVRGRLPSDRQAVVFDVGANVGEYAKEILERWGRVDLRCFEPSPSTYAVLGERLKDRAGVMLENLGLSDQNGALTFYTRGEGSKVASVYKRRSSRWELDQTEEIRVVTLDAYCAENSIDTLDFLKLDVEGHELSVLIGAETMLRSGAICFIQFEFGRACVDARVFFRDFWELLNRDYILYRVLAHGLVMVPSYDETCEVFKHATNYLAERRRAP
jgi:FkbM family methyltransferase